MARTRYRRRRFGGVLLALCMLGAAALLIRGLCAQHAPEAPPEASALAGAGEGFAAGSEPVPPVKRNKAEALARLEELADDERVAAVLTRAEEYPAALLSALSNNLELADFALGYLSADETASGGFTQAELEADCPLLMQWDARWGYTRYGNGALGLTGCGPTSLAMVILALTGNAEATPDAVAAYSEEKGYCDKDEGTKWTLFSHGAADWGLTVRELPLWEDSLRQALAEGALIVCCMGEGDFTTVGHFIVLRGCEEAGFRVLDPNSRKRSETVWSYERLSTQIRNIWAFEGM